MNPDAGDCGRSSDIVKPFSTEHSVTKPNILACEPEGNVSKACTGMRSDINLLNKSFAISDETIFLSIRPVFGLHYAKMAAKCMGLTVTDDLLNRPVIKRSTTDT